MPLSQGRLAKCLAGEPRRVFSRVARMSVPVLAAGLALPLATCQREGESPLRCCNVVLINIDTLRADHLGAYGYFRDTSPTIDRLAREGAVFSQALAASSYTRESVAALFTGRYPSCIGALGWDAHPPPGVPTLAPTFRRAGYFTAFLSLTTMLTHPAFSDGFERVEHLTDQWGLSRAGPRLAERGLELWAQVPREKKRFFYLHFLDPHGPYDPPPEVLERFAPPVSEQVLDLYRDLRPRLPELVAEGFGRRDARFRELVRRYDAEIAHTDDSVRLFLQGLADRGDLDRTLVVVTADHGEEFLEHGFVEHAWTLYQEVLHVPLVFWRPGLVPPGRYSGWVSGVDVAPTLLAMLGFPPAPRSDGIPLLRASAPGAPLAAEVPERPVFAELWIGERNVARSVVERGWKYVAAVRWLEPAERPAAAARENDERREAGGGQVPEWKDAVREELFRLGRDPREKRNLVEHARGVAAEMRARLGQLASRCAPGPSAQRALSADEAERMRVLGY